MKEYGIVMIEYARRVKRESLDRTEPVSRLQENIVTYSGRAVHKDFLKFKS